LSKVEKEVRAKGKRRLPPRQPSEKWIAHKRKQIREYEQG